MSAPALVLAIPLVVGIVSGAAWGVSTPVALLALACGTAAATLSFVRDRAPTLAWCVACGAAASGALLGARAETASRAMTLATWHASLPDPDSVVRLQGTLTSDAAAGNDSTALALEASEVRTATAHAVVAGGIRASVRGLLATAARAAWRQGRAIETTAVLRAPLDYHDPGVPSDRERLARAGTALLATIKSGALVSVRSRAGPIDEAASAMRAFVRRAVTASVGYWSPRSAGVVTAILIGDRTGLDPDDERRLQDAGTYHVIAISGGNIALLTMMLLVGARWIRVGPRISSGAAIAFLAFYGYAAGLAPSVLRATIAGIVYLAGRVLDQRGPALNAIGVAAVLAAATDPLSIVDPGFVLSFGATTAIVVVAARMLPPRTRDHEAGATRRAVRSALVAAAELGAATLCAEIALAPVGARLFGRISLAGLGLNFLAIPLMCVIQFAGMAAVAAFAVSSTAAAGCGWIAHAGTVALIWSAGLVDRVPWLVRDVPPPAWWVIAAWYASCAGVLVTRRRWRIAAVVVAVAAGWTMLAGPVPARAVTVQPPPPGWTRFVFIDVGQGDAILVWPTGSDPVLVDTGGTASAAFDVGRRVTTPALWALRVTRLSSVLLTHGDPDHMGGASAVLRAFRPRTLVEGIAVPRHEPLQALHALASQLGVAREELRAGTTLRLGVATVRVLNPPPPDWERQKVRNDDSVVLDVQVGGVSVLLTGDISATAERAIVPALEPAPLRIVKAAHHGSAGSSSQVFVDAAQARAVVFSAGARNPFGHPSKVALDRYLRSGAHVFRTDQDGAVFVDTDGRTAVVWTWWSRRREVFVAPAPRLVHGPTASTTGTTDATVTTAK